MAIIHITGPARSGKSLFGNALRNTHIGQSRPADGVVNGALLVDDTQDGEARYLLEKLIDGEALGRPGVGPAVPRAASEIPWKNDVLVIFVGDRIALLDEFEAIAPGFTAMFGPVREMALTA